MAYIYLAPIGLSDLSCLELLDETIAGVFQVETKVCELPIHLMSTYDTSRNQYNSSLLLLQVINSAPSDAFRILGIAEVDLFIPILTFVFGEAQLNGTGAVVSLHRLNSRFYGLPENEEMLKERLVKEAVHELGHTFGLRHCLRPGCVMNSSTYVEGVDQKSAELCFPCQQSISAKKNNKPAFIERIRRGIGL